MERINNFLQLAFGGRGEIFGVDLFERAAEVDLGLDAPGGSDEKFCLHCEFFRADVDGVEPSHHCGIAQAEGLTLPRRTLRLHFASARDSICRTRSRDRPRISPISRRVSSSSCSTP